MIIKSKPLPIPVLKFFVVFIHFILRFRFNKITIRQAELKANHSYVLMCNHFSFWDGIWALYLSIYAINSQQKIKGLYIMSVKKQMEKKWWLQYLGSFSIDPNSFTVDESLSYAAEVLNTPGNILLYYPQGNLESLQVRNIEFKDGLNEIVTKIQGNCQLIWCSTLTEYFESLQPSLYFNLFNCGTNHDFDFQELQKNVNTFHRQAIQSNIRFTSEK